MIHLRLARLLLAGAALVVAGCRDTNVSPGPEYPPRGTLVPGDLQRDVVGDQLPEPLVVRVMDPGGAPFAAKRPPSR